MLENQLNLLDTNIQINELSNNSNGIWDTINDWQKSISDMADIYEYRINRLKYIEERNMIAVFIITTILTTISLTQFNFDESVYPTLTLTIKFVFTGLALLATMISGWLKIKKYSETMYKYAIFLERLRNLDRMIYLQKTKKNISENNKDSINIFIEMFAEKYNTILKEKPHMDMNIYYKSLRESKISRKKIDSLIKEGV